MSSRFPPVYVLVCTSALLLASCKGATEVCTGVLCDGGTSVPTTVTVAPSSLTFTSVGATEQLGATVLDQDGQTIANPSVAWTSSPTSVASVSSTGLVRAEGNGTAMITATAGTASGTASVTVADACAATGATTMVGSFEFGSLTTSDCPLEGGYYADFWTLSVQTTDRVQIDLISDDFDAYLELLDDSDVLVAENDDATDDGRPFTSVPSYDLASRIDETLGVGTYVIVARSYGTGETGAYQLSVGPGLLCPETDAVFPGESTSGAALDPGDCSYGTWYADVYAVEVSSSATVTFDMSSTDFDTYLTLFDPSGNYIDDNDDTLGTDAQIAISLTPGWYVIEASSFNDFATGSYTLSVH